MPKVKNNSTLEASKEPQRKKNRAVKAAKELQASFENKKFSDLTGGEKDSLLQAVALRLNMILPE